MPTTVMETTNKMKGKIAIVNLLDILRSAISIFVLVTLISVAIPKATLDWDAGTESRRHSEGTGGENPTLVRDTRPFWARSKSVTTAGRVAYYPAGYINTGLTCYSGPDTYHAPSRLGNCPPGYTNMGLD